MTVLKEEIEDEEKWESDYTKLKEEIQPKRAELPSILASTNQEEDLARAGKLKQNVPVLRQKLEAFVQTSQSQPRRMVAREPVEEERLGRELAELESSVDNLTETLVIRIKVRTMTPQLETLLQSTQRTVQEATQPEDEHHRRTASH